ncbi:MAG TPA: MFS transporter [Polyangiaceae bacterium]|nr:MFS transporter [Polyangiaceae bacterium]
MTFATRVLTLFSLINLVNYVDRYVVAAVLEPLGHELHLNDAERGRLTFVFVIVYMLAAPVFGALAERMHRPRLIAIGVAIWSLATVAGAFVHDYTQLLVARSFVGVGEAAYASLGPAVLSDCIAENDRARRFTWFYLAIPVGSALGYALGGVVAQYYGWRAAFFVAGLPGLAFAYRLALLADPERGALDNVKETEKLGSLGARLRAAIGNRVWVACTVSYVAYTFGMGALSTWAPSFLQRRFEVGPGPAGTAFGGIAVVTGVLGTFLGGYLTDRWQKKFPNLGVDMSAVTLLLAAPCVIWALHAPSLGLTYVAFFVGMLLLFVNTSPVNALTVSCLPASARATGTAFNVLLIHLFGDAISPEWVGVRSEAATQAGANAAAGLVHGMMIAVPAIVLSGAILFLARTRSATTVG